MAAHSSILAWKIPWTEKSDDLYSPWGCKELDTTEHTHTFSAVPFYWCVVFHSMNILQFVELFTH